MSKTFSIHSTPFYKSVEQQYIKVLCLDREPDTESGLKQIVKRVKIDKISLFKQEPGDDTCVFIIMNPNKPNDYAKIDDIQMVFSWLMQHGFTIDTTLTQMFSHGDVKMKNPLVCFIRK